MDAQAGFIITNADVYAFEIVVPYVEWITHIMSWVNLITFGICFLVVLHSKMPIIIRRALEDAEDKAEEA